VPAFDCRRCGACCCNPADNRRAGADDYVDVTPADELWHAEQQRRRYTVEGPKGVHLRLHGGDRCAALVGPIGQRVRCAIYDLRPRPCRRVQAGDEECRERRRERGLSLRSDGRG